MTATLDPAPRPPTPAPRVDETSPPRYFLEPVAFTTVAIFAAIATARLVRPPWVDEITTLWEVEGSLPDMLARHFEFESNGPLYGVLMWTWTTVAGHSVFSMRIPSLLACILTLVVLFRLAEELDGRRTAWVAVALLTVHATVLSAATDARPYGLALLATTVANAYLIRWVNDGSRRNGTIAAVSAGLALNLHLLTSFGLLAFPYLIGVGLRKRTLTPSKVFGAMLVGGLVLVPLLPQLVVNASNATRFDTELAAPWNGQIQFLFPGAVLLAGLVALVVGGFPRSRPGLGPWQVRGLAVWTVAGVLVPFLLARFANADVYLPRYLIWTLPAASLLVAAGISRLQRPMAATLAVAAAFVAVAPTWVDQVDESASWEMAVDWVNANTDPASTVVVLEPMHVMGKDRDFFVDEGGEWVFEDAPSLMWVNPVEAAHPIDAPSFGLPHASSTWGPEYLDAVLDQRASGATVVVMVGNLTRPERDYTELVRDRMAARGYTEQPAPDLDREVLLFRLDGR